MKLSVSTTQHYVIGVIAPLIAVYTSMWIVNNSGLSPNGSGEQVWFARTFAKVCVFGVVMAIWASIFLYATHRWNLFRGTGPK